jgi:hypothetical protein
MKQVLLSYLIVIVTSLSAQEQSTEIPEAVKSIDGIVNEVLEIISAEKGEKRDLEAFRKLFHPDARLGVLNQGGNIPVPFETVSVEEFIELLKDPYYEEGFVEYELGKRVDEYNGIAQVFQSFYAKDSKGVEGKGVTSYQLVYYNERWWIANIIWTESNNTPIPEQYLDEENKSTK